jgi:hypothetical protein
VTNLIIFILRNGEKTLKITKFSFFSFSGKISPSCENLQAEKKKKKKTGWDGWGNLVAMDKEISHGK